MKLSDVVSFRKDLLFNGAVQLSWFEKDQKQARKAAEHYIFHGPDYHGVAKEDYVASSHKLVDTASFTLDILERVNKDISDEPFALAIAGYGTGKSHLAVTLATLLSGTDSKIKNKIINNISMADDSIGNRVRIALSKTTQPYLVVAINGMQDFDLNSEIIRQILLFLNERDLDTGVLENLRPRFKSAINFTESFFAPLKDDFHKYFYDDCTLNDIVERLKCQDEVTFRKISEIYEKKMGSPIHAVGQESLQDFVRVTKETYCGPGKPYAGILIIFDEFGRYLEFAVQKPHVAGSGALQQLFECVQANGDGVFLLCFIQFELNAYISRIAPELREDLNRYVTRYDSVRKVRLSTNMETLVANLIEKRDLDELNRQISYFGQIEEFQRAFEKWFPDIKNHAVWTDKKLFEKVICKGCWPLHPLSAWILYKLSSVGKYLQQRSALSLLAEVYSDFQDKKIENGWTIAPVDICNESMINEFLSTERYGQQGATAHAFETVMHKYEHELTAEGKRILKAVLVSTKIGVKVESKKDYLHLISIICGIKADLVRDAINILEYDYAVLEWNDRLRQYEIAGDAVPKRAFMSFLESKASAIDLPTRADIFSQKFMEWTQKKSYSTDFGSQNNISTREWNYEILYSNVSMLKGHINYALKSFHDARGVDEEKGRLIYCYVGPESKIDTIKDMAKEYLKSSFNGIDHIWENGAPISVILLHDYDGTFGNKIAEYWVLSEEMNGEESQKFSNFIFDRKNTIDLEMENQFIEMERLRHIVFATDKNISGSRIKNMLTTLFDTIYHKRIPFPFDGFHTAKGNAAKDCQLFTKELFLGNMDREWISARSPQQRNRAYSVFEHSWGAIADDGSIRLKPSNKSVREIVEYMDAYLEGDKDLNEQKPMNLGKMMRLLCAPPYGCNIASAGLLLAMFIGRRKKTLNLMKDEQNINFETWLQNGIPRNFFELSVLDVTDIVLVSEESLSEWEKLLEDWSSESLLTEKVSYRKKARKLEERIPVPQQLFYKYQHLKEQSIHAISRIKSYNEKLTEAIEKIEKGKEKENVNLLSWGAAELLELYNTMCLESDKWPSNNVDGVKKELSKARILTQNYFKPWLAQMSVNNIEHLGKFKHVMIVNIGSNLKKLELEDEFKLLEEHVEKVEKEIVFITKIKRTVSDIDNMLSINKITNSTQLSVLNNWLEQVQDFAGRLKEAKKRTDILQNDVKTATTKLAHFQKECKEQIEYYKERVNKIYNIETISSFSDIANMINEVTSLINVYEGYDKDIEDFKLIQKQLELVEMHFKLLDDDSLNEKELKDVFNRCLKESEENFCEDAPPLDNEFIYDSILYVIKNKRENMASEWMRHNYFQPKEIENSNALTTLSIKTKLQKMPCYLSTKQLQKVSEAINACEERLDELEVEGLMAKFYALTDRNRRIFLSKISNYFTLS